MCLARVGNSDEDLLSFCSLCMKWQSFYENETVKCSWSNSQSSSGDVVHVFMSSFSETADADRVRHVCVCVCVCVCV